MYFRDAMQRFKMASSGSIAAGAGVLFSLAAGATFFAIDSASAFKFRNELQRAADTAALSSARQIPFITGDPTTSSAPDGALTSISATIVDALIIDDLDSLTTSAILREEKQVRVTVSAKYRSIFDGLLGIGNATVSVSSTAESHGGDDVCLVALGTRSGQISIEASGASRVTASNCAIYSGSPSDESLKLSETALMDASLICSAGGYSGGVSNTTYPVITDCPQIEDPLADRVKSSFSLSTALPCLFNDRTYDGGTHTMEPGVYCGKTDLKNGTDVWMQPGEYIFRNGELHAHDTSRLAGSQVSLTFEDKHAFFRFMDDSVIDLAAPVNGDMAGVLLASRDLCDASSGSDDDDDDENDCNNRREFEISSPNVRKLLGTIHMPSDHLMIDTTGPVSSEAAFTIIVAGSVEMKQSPTLVLNTDYAATDVPVPQGFLGTPNVRMVD